MKDIKSIIESPKLFEPENKDLFLKLLVFHFKLTRSIFIDPRFTRIIDVNDVLDDRTMRDMFIYQMFYVSRYLYTRKEQFNSIKHLVDIYFSNLDPNACDNPNPVGQPLYDILCPDNNEENMKGVLNWG